MHYDVIIIGAGAAGLMCAGVAGQGGARVLVLDHNDKPGEKIRISGGGRCNFTNLHSSPKNFLSQNPHFCKSALAQYGPQDFIAMVERYGITYHEKVQTGMQLGQLFCDGKSQQIIDMLLSECTKGGVDVKLGQSVLAADKNDDGFSVTTDKGSYKGAALVIACGGPSIEKIGGSNFAYKLAEHFGLNLITPRPALVPLTLTDDGFAKLKALSGVAVPAIVKSGNGAFNEAMLITHRGLSGPAILQISSYWREGETIQMDILPAGDVCALLSEARQTSGKQSPKSFLETLYPARLAAYLASSIDAERLADLTAAQIMQLTDHIHSWTLKPAGTEGYRKAEVTLGGIDTHALSSKTMQAKAVAGLYVIGEAVDVTGHLGGHNFQWAWASGAAAGRAISAGP